MSIRFLPSLRTLAGCLCALLLACSMPAEARKPVRTRTNIDAQWKFQKGDVPSAQEAAFDDAAWRTLDVPHDWAIEDDYDEHSPVLRGGGYLGGGIAWYRKELRLDRSYRGKRICIEFEGVQANSDVWCNGTLLGHRPMGYLPLYYDITDLVHTDGTPDVIAVRVDNTAQPASRWYTGAGIYRHVYIHAFDPLHIERWGVFVYASDVSAGQATVSVESAVVNESATPRQFTLRTTLTAPSGRKTVTRAQTLEVNPGDTVRSIQSVQVPDPELWDIDSPNIYEAVTTVSTGRKVIDEQVDRFGIKESHFESETGFWLNGRNIRVLGACVHNDGGAVGSAVPASVWERRIKLLKEAGCNAIRGAHCPMDPAFYEMCDKLGMLLFDETFDTWTAAKPNGQKAYNLYFREWWKYDAAAQIRRVRNHPSIFLYSLGNEIRDNLNGEEGRRTFLEMRDLTRRLDPTRPITMALFNPQGMRLYTNGFSEMLDVIGQNYNEMGLLNAWKGKEGRKIIGTENTPSRSAWLVMKNNPQYAGQFLWTGFEYLGESDWPKISWNTALFNRNGGWKHTGWERRSWWTDEPMVRIWRKDDMPNGQMTEDYTPLHPDVPVSLTLYSNCEEVELFLNGKSLGRQPVPEDDAPNVYEFAYEPGEVRAVGRIGGRDVAEHRLQSAGKPVRLHMTTEQASIPYDWEEVVYVTATVEDADGIRFPNSDARITLQVSGPGELVAIDNNDVYSHERYKSDWRTAYKGQVTGIIRATAKSGTITVTATADGLEASSVQIRVGR